MRLTIECSGCKATLISGPSAKNRKEKTEKKRRKRGCLMKCPPSPPSKDHGEKIEKHGKSPPGRKRQSLSDHFQLSSSSPTSSTLSSALMSFSVSSRSLCSAHRVEDQNGHTKRDLRSLMRREEASVPAKVDCCVVVVEHSSDPYGDFRRSMVEMMMVRKKLGDGDLHGLLRRYLSLNPPQHHPVILKAFADLYTGSSVHNIDHLVSKVV